MNGCSYCLDSRLLDSVSLFEIERVQRSAFAIILGYSYSSYENFQKILKMESLAERRHALCLSFARKSYKLEKFNKWFCEDEVDSDLLVKGVKARTSRYKKSPIPYMTDLLNSL